MSRKQSIALTRQFLVTRLFPNLNSPKEYESNQQKGTVTSKYPTRKERSIFNSLAEISSAESQLRDF